MYDFEVVIDAGHGGDDPGAVSGDTKEKDLTLLISQYMYERFKEMGVPVAMTRTTDETVNPTERVNRILNAFGNNEDVVVISNHINSNTTGTAEGAEVIYALRNDDTLASNILNALENAGQIGRSYYQRRLPSDPSKDYYFIHRNTGVTEPVIVEYGFINNANDLNRIKQNYREYVNAVVDAVIATKMGGEIPPQGTISYVVKSGDTLWKLAREFNTTVDAIKRLNNLTSDALSVGQILLIPSNAPIEGGTSYTVQSGDSLWSIARKFNTTVAELKRVNNLTSDNLSVGQVLIIPSTSDGEDSESEGTTTYTVQSGDSLYKIAGRFNTTVAELKRLNNLASDTLSIGQVLIVPSTTTGGSTNAYTVQSGDSLWSIARKFNTTVDELKKLNNLTSNNLQIGQVLKVPTTDEVINPDEGESLTNYVVQSGDSLYKIAMKFNTTANDIKRINGLTNDYLSVGQVLRIPTSNSTTFTYVVKNGDSLYKIAQTYNTTVDELRRLNNLTSNSLVIGQQLVIPRK